MDGLLLLLLLGALRTVNAEKLGKVDATHFLLEASELCIAEYRDWVFLWLLRGVLSIGNNYKLISFDWLELLLLVIGYYWVITSFQEPLTYMLFRFPLCFLGLYWLY